MFDFLFKKERLVESLIYAYLETLKSTHESFLTAFEACLESPQCENFDFHIKQTHKFESKADDIREEIKSLMYGKALIPESRGDIMGLLEAIDSIPRLLQDVLYTIQTQRLEIPDFLVPDIKELVRISLESCDLLVRQVFALFKKTDDIRTLLNTIDAKESHCDHFERRIITRVFDSDLDPFKKLQIKELVSLIENISDQADQVSRRVNIINLKRRV